MHVYHPYLCTVCICMCVYLYIFTFGAGSCPSAVRICKECWKGWQVARSELLKKTQHSDPSVFGKTNHPFFSWTTWVVCESHAVEKDGFINPWLPWLRWRVIGAADLCHPDSWPWKQLREGRKRMEEGPKYEHYKPMRWKQWLCTFVGVDIFSLYIQNKYQTLVAV